MEKLKRPLILDGGLGTLLETKYNCDLRHPLWSTHVLEKTPEIIYNAHKDFCGSGADIHITCTYQTNLMAFNNDHEAFERSIKNSVNITKNVAENYEKETGKKVYVAGSCGTYASVPLSNLTYTGAYLTDLKSDKEKIDWLVNYHKDRFEIIDNLDCDFLAWETMPTRVEGVACSKLIAKAKTPSWITFTLKDEATLANGDSIVSVLESLIGSPNLIGVGVNCCDLNCVKGAVKIIKTFYNDPKNNK